MSRSLYPVTWAKFDESVGILARHFEQRHVRAVYGVPRGGLVLAVAISHALRVPLVTEPGDGVLWVDDIVDSGSTMLPEITARPNGLRACLIRRGTHHPVRAAITITTPVWVIFPWESRHYAEIERAQYESRHAAGQ